MQLWYKAVWYKSYVILFNAYMSDLILKREFQESNKVCNWVKTPQYWEILENEINFIQKD